MNRTQRVHIHATVRVEEHVSTEITPAEDALGFSEPTVLAPLNGQVVLYGP